MFNRKRFIELKEAFFGGSSLRGPYGALDAELQFYERAADANVTFDDILDGGGTGVEFWQNGDYIVKTFKAGDFAYNILTGAALYTPTVGDWILDAWPVVTTEFNGSSPKFTLIHGSQTLTQNRIEMQLYEGTSLAQAGGTIAAYALAAAWDYTQYVPAKVLTSTPLKIRLDDGVDGDPGSTQGAGELWLTIATPVSGSVIQGPPGTFGALDWQAVSSPHAELWVASDAPIKVAKLGDSGIGKFRGAFLTSDDYDDGVLFVVPVGCRPPRATICSAPGLVITTNGFAPIFPAAWDVADFGDLGAGMSPGAGFSQGYSLVVHPDGTVRWGANGSGYAGYGLILDGISYLIDL
mgnify:FL=1